MTASRTLIVRQLKALRYQVLLVAAGLQLLGVLVLGLVPDEETSPVRRFVLRSHSHGIYLEDARKLGSGAFPELAAILREQAAKPYWVNAAVVMGLVGYPAALDTLRSFTWHRFRGPVDRATFTAITGWPSALAVGSQPGDKRILQLLSAGSEGN